MNELAIETNSLVKHYSSVHALDGLTMSVPRGAVYGFLGRNGAGKSTTIKTLLGLVRANGGRARVFGQDCGPDQIGVLERTAFVSERKALYENMTARQLVRFNRGFYPNWSDEAVEKYAHLLDIPMDPRISKLSNGNRTNSGQQETGIQAIMYTVGHVVAQASPAKPEQSAAITEDDKRTRPNGTRS